MNFIFMLPPRRKIRVMARLRIFSSILWAAFSSLVMTMNGNLVPIHEIPVPILVKSLPINNL